MGTGASFALDAAGESLDSVTPEHLENARLQADLVAYVQQLNAEGIKDRALAELGPAAFAGGVAGTWTESFYNSDLVLTVQEADPAALHASPTPPHFDPEKYVGLVSGHYKGGEGTVTGLLLRDRTAVHGLWQEQADTGAFRFDLVEGGLVFCGPFFHRGKYMGTWWGRRAELRRFENRANHSEGSNNRTDPSADSDRHPGGSAAGSVEAGTGGGGAKNSPAVGGDKSQDGNGDGGGGGGGGDGNHAVSATLQREFLEREEWMRQEQAAAAAAKKHALRERVARRKQQSGRVIPAAVQNAAGGGDDGGGGGGGGGGGCAGGDMLEDLERLLTQEPMTVRRAMVEDLLFDPNLDEDQVVALMQRSLDTHLGVLARLFAVAALVGGGGGSSGGGGDGGGGGGAPTLPRARLWSHFCQRVEALSIDESDVGVMVGKVFGEDDGDEEEEEAEKEDEEKDGEGAGHARGDEDGGELKPALDLDFAAFVHFLFHLSNAFTLMHEGMLGSDHSLDKLLPVLQGPLLPPRRQ